MSDAALQLLLDSYEPAIRHAALIELLDRPAADPQARALRAAIAGGAIVGRLVDGPTELHPYQKWRGAPDPERTARPQGSSSVDAGMKERRVDAR